MSNQNQEPTEQTKRNTLLLAGGLTIFILLLAVGGWYMFRWRDLSKPSVIPASDSPVGEAPFEIPEAEPEEDAPGTPAPGFLDDFEDGLDPAWTVHYGDPFTVKGQLTSNVGAGLSAGDPSWENYQIEFDVDTSQIDCPFADSSNSVGVRTVDFDHAYWFVFTSCKAAWSLFAGGVPDLLPETSANTLTGRKHITIKAVEETMAAYENGAFLSSINDTKFPTGGIFLQIEAQTLYDNVQVTLLP